MTKQLATNRSCARWFALRAILSTSAACAVVLTAGCDRSEKPVPPGVSSSEPSKKLSAITSLEAPAAATQQVAILPAAEPARVSDAAQQLDLTTIPVMEGAEHPSDRSVTSLAYRVPGTIEGAFKFHQDHLRAKGWSELAGTSVIPQAAASGTFSKSGLHFSVTIIPDKPGTVAVSLRHHGNIDFTKLPLPANAKPLYAGPLTAIFVVEEAPDAAASAIADGLAKKGWVRYGEARPTAWFKQNAVKLSVTTAAAPAHGGKTAVNFGSEMLPADIPAPDGANDIQFSDSTKTLTLQTRLSQDECVRFYRDALGKAGWDTKMDAPMKIDADQVIVFRNAANDMLKVAMRPGQDGALRVAAGYQTGAEIAEMNRKLDAQAEALKARKAAERAPN